MQFRTWLHKDERFTVPPPEPDSSRSLQVVSGGGVEVAVFANDYQLRQLRDELIRVYGLPNA
jgi:hypothetical protein